MGLRIPTEDMEFDTEDVELRSLDGDLREIGDSSFFREDMPAERSGRQLIGTASEWEKHAESRLQDAELAETLPPDLLEHWNRLPAA